MKRTAWLGVLAAGAVLGGYFLAQAQLPGGGAGAEGRKEPPTLRTAGAATVRVKPDAARVFFGVQTSAATVKEARLDNNNRVRKIMDGLVGLKIPDLKTKTSDVQVEIVYGHHDGRQLPPIVGYRVTTTFTVLIAEEDAGKLGGLAGRVLDSALENGANQVQQVVFLNRAGMTEARRKALTQAVEDGLANARALAAGANKNRVEVVNIDGQPTYHERPYGWNRAQVAQALNVAIPAGGDGEANLVVGDLEVTCTVNLTCTH